MNKEKIEQWREDYKELMIPNETYYHQDFQKIHNSFESWYIEGRKAAQAEIDELISVSIEQEEKCDNLKRLLKDICDEWDEGCEPDCSKYGHSEECRATNLVVAKRKMREEIEKRDELLREAKNRMIAYNIFTNGNNDKLSGWLEKARAILKESEK